MGKLSRGLGWLFLKLDAPKLFHNCWCLSKEVPSKFQEDWIKGFKQDVTIYLPLFLGVGKVSCFIQGKTKETFPEQLLVNDSRARMSNKPNRTNTETRILSTTINCGKIDSTNVKPEYPSRTNSSNGRQFCKPTREQCRGDPRAK